MGGITQWKPGSRRRGIGILGAGGGFGRFIASAIGEIEGAYVAAIAGSNPARLRRTAKKMGVAAAYLSVDELIADPHVDVVVVCTPPGYHAAHGMAAARAGKAVFMEKPVATTLADALALADAVKASGVACVVDYVMRYNPLFDIIKSIETSGVLGRLRQISFQNCADDEGLAPEHWFWNRDVSGGILIEHGVHFFDIYGHIVGAPPRLVRGLRTERMDDVLAGSAVVREDTMMADVIYDNNVLATYYHAFDKPREMARTEALLAFDRGYLTVEGWIALSLRLDALVDSAGYAQLRTIEGLTLDLFDEPGPQVELVGDHGADWSGPRQVRGTWRHVGTKEQVYRSQVGSALQDLLTTMDDPGHRPRATMAEGISSLDVAARATQDARTAT